MPVSTPKLVVGSGYICEQAPGRKENKRGMRDVFQNLTLKLLGVCA